MKANTRQSSIHQTQCSFRSIVWLGLALWMVLPSSQVDASEARLCVGHFRKKRYIRASQCFQDLAKSLETKQPLTQGNKRQIGSYLRNAALALRKEAKGVKGNRVYYLKEQAFFLYQKVLKKKYYEFASQRRLVKIALDKLESEIAYRQVVLLTNNPSASVQVLGGYRFPPTQHKGKQIQLRLRPGTYTFIVSFPKAGSDTKTLVVKPNQPLVTLQFQPQALPVQKPPPGAITRSINTLSPGVWALIAIGSSLVAGGAVTMGIAAANKTSTDSWGDEQKKLGNLSIGVTRQVRDGIDNANSQLTAGIVVGGTGLLAIVVGGLWYAARPTPPPPPKPRRPNDDGFSFLTTP